jgi:hypothetical protein
MEHKNLRSGVYLCEREEGRGRKRAKRLREGEREREKRRRRRWRRRELFGYSALVISGVLEKVNRNAEKMLVRGENGRFM